MTMQAELLLDTRATVGESPVWDERESVLWWVDIEGMSLNRLEVSTGKNLATDMGERIGCVVPSEDGTLVVAAQSGFAYYDAESRRTQSICDPEAHLPANRFNDGKCDPAGRLWAGTMNLEPRLYRTGSLYSLDHRHEVTQHLDELGIANGLAWSEDAKTMYYVDSLAGTIDALDFDVEAGTISNRRAIFDVPAAMGTADGMAIDSDGMLWVAFWGGWCVAQIDPRQGRVLNKIQLPVSAVASCAFGGRNFDELYITTATQCLTADELREQPLSGSIFVARPGAQGFPADKFHALPASMPHAT